MSGTRRCLGRGRHGHLRGGKRPPEYAVWAMLLQKCLNPSYRGYQSYGGSGAQVCVRWREIDGYTNFLADVGPQPFPGAGLRRLDPNGNFEPGNVTWDDTRSCRLLTHNGRTQSITAWARELGVRAGTLRARLHQGWSIGEVLGRRVSPRCPSRYWRRRKPRADSAEQESLGSMPS
jgi:hypothetical protein